MIRRSVPFLAAFLALLSAAPAAQRAQAQTEKPVVHAVLFHSPMCSFCYKIIDGELPPLIQRFGNQLDILDVNIEIPAGMTLYQAALEAFQVTGGIPVLFLDDIVLKGNAIPEQLPGIVDAYLAQGGADWPGIPGLEEYRMALQSTPTPSPTATLVPATPTFAMAPSVTAGPVARAVLFFSPTCSHCRHVQSDILPGLQKQFGKRLEILSVSTYSEEGYDLYQAALSLFGLERAGVPFLVIGNQFLLGSDEIAEFLSPLIEQALERGGVDWPAIPGLKGALETAGMPVEPGSVSEADWLRRIRANIARDPAGNAVSIAVLMGMMASLGAAVVYARRQSIHSASRIPAWVIPVLCTLGLGIAGYLAYVEVGRVEAVCGPVGDCNTVQQSEYARLFGILPIGVLGMLGYVLILAAWFLGKISRGRWAALADLGIFGMATFGFLFSLYLTFLEPFVIRASCSWCLTSAILMTALFWLSLRPGKAALSTLTSNVG